MLLATLVELCDVRNAPCWHPCRKNMCQSCCGPAVRWVGLGRTSLFTGAFCSPRPAQAKSSNSGSSSAGVLSKAVLACTQRWWLCLLFTSS